MMIKVYEDFHRIALKQKKIIQKNNFTYKIILSVVEKYITPPKKILDIGCGVGTLSLYLANKGNSVYGIDISKNGIRAAQRNAIVLQLNKVNFKAMDYPNELPKGKFEVIICSEVIEHLEDDRKAIKAMHNLLKKGGIAIISTPSLNAPLYKMNLTKAFDKRVGHIRRYSLKKLIDLCEKQGFQVIETRKTEGIVRNFLFINPLAGKFVRFVKYFMVDIVSFVDYLSLKIFGESQLFIIVKKPL